MATGYNDNGVVLYEDRDRRIAVIATCLKRGSKNPKTGAMVQTFIVGMDEDPQTAVHNGHDAKVCFQCPLRPINGGKGRFEPDYVVAEEMGWRWFGVKFASDSGANPLGSITCPASKEAGHRTTCTKCGLCEGAQKQAKNIVIRDHSVKAKTCYVNVSRSVKTVWRCYRRGGYRSLAQMGGVELFRDRIFRFGSYGEPTLIPLNLVRDIVGVVKTHTGYTHQWRRAWAQGYRPYFMASVNA